MNVYKAASRIRLQRIGGKRFRNAVGKRIRTAGVYGSKKYRSGFIFGRYFFLCVGRILKAGIRISQNELIGQLSDMKSAHPGQAACPCWASTVPQLGKHVAHDEKAAYPSWASTVPIFC